MSSTPPAWPEKPYNGSPESWMQHGGAEYQRALASAALHALGIAVAALRRIETRDGIDGYPDDAWCVAAREALELIGPLPDQNENKESV